MKFNVLPYPKIKTFLLEELTTLHHFFLVIFLKILFNLLLTHPGDSESGGVGFNPEEESGLCDEVHYAGLQ